MFFYTVLNLDIFKWKQPEKSYEFTNCILKLKFVISNKYITNIVVFIL